MKIKFNQNGMSLVTVIIAAAVILVLGLAITPAITQGVKTQKIMRTRDSAVLVRDDIFATLNSDAAWAETVAANPLNNATLSCLRTNGATCPTGALGTIAVVRADGTTIIDNQATEGFDYTGNRCLSYSAASGHTSCVYKFTITAFCDAPCGPTVLPPGSLVAPFPKIRLQASFSFSPVSGLLDYLKNNVNVNSTQYTFNFRRGVDTPGLDSFCFSMGGTFDPVANTCSAPGAVPADFDCKAALGTQGWFVGFNADGSPNCVKDIKAGIGCGNDMAVTGIQADGSFRCAGY